MGVGGYRHAPATLPPRRKRYPLYRRRSGSRGLSGRVLKFAPTGIRSSDHPACSELLYDKCVMYLILIVQSMRWDPSTVFQLSRAMSVYGVTWSCYKSNASKAQSHSAGIGVFSTERQERLK